MLEQIRPINSKTFLVCGEEGALGVWITSKKTPIISAKGLHNGRSIQCIDCLWESDLVITGGSSGYI